jgi:hypothetical protein
VVPRTEAVVTIDAVLDEPAWEQALALDVNVEVRPGENVRAPVTTVVLLTYEHTYATATGSGATTGSP